MKSIITCLICVIFVQFSLALYEDQALKFDWKQNFVGEVKHAGFHSTPRTSVLVVGTKANVVAGLDSDSGSILWRHVQEDGKIGTVTDLRVLGKHTISVSGPGQMLFLRIWDSVSGALVQEHLLRPGREPDLVSIQNGQVVLLTYDGGEMEILQYSFDNKKVGDGVRRVVSTTFPASNLLEDINCVVSDDLIVVCTAGRGLHLLHLGEETISWETKEVGQVIGDSLSVTGTKVEVKTPGGVVRLNTGTGVYTIDSNGVGVSMSAGCGNVQLNQRCVTEGRDSSGHGYCKEYSSDLEIVSGDDRVVYTMGATRGKVVSMWAECEQEAFQLVLGMEDGSLLSLTPKGNLMFLREEGLAHIDLVKMLAVGQAEKFTHRSAYQGILLDPGLLLQNFVNRIKRHVSLLQSAFLAVTDFRLSGEPRVGPGVGDRFGLRKVVVTVTTQGGLYGLDSGSGTVLWQRLVPGTGVSLHIQRDGMSDRESAQSTLVYRHNRSTYFVLLFNPVTGAVISDQPIDMELDQVLQLPQLEDQNLHPILLVGKDSSLQVFPSSVTSLIPSLPPLFVVISREGHLTGNLVTVQSNDKVTLLPVWSLSHPGVSVLDIRTRHNDEIVHSAGRVMADRSVLFKYMNPNLAIVMSEGTDSTSKTFITVQVIDLVTGKLFFSAIHKKVTPPYHVVHSENWAVYTFYNEKSRRTELVSLELYEGKTQNNATMFSSVENSVIPLVERQAYILPTSQVVALQETLTGKGITTKHLLVATSHGAILDLPIHMVDPRRPALNTPPHMREAGLPPYIPELPLPHESILNYNQSIAAIKGVVTSTSGLESTVLVFVHGLDIYGTRLTPSKGFDLINPDFDYLMISAVLVVLVALSYIARKFAQRKMLNQAWK